VGKGLSQAVLPRHDAVIGRVRCAGGCGQGPGRHVQELRKVYPVELLHSIYNLKIEEHQLSTGFVFPGVADQ
jgi:hypothetical protein